MARNGRKKNQNKNKKKKNKVRPNFSKPGDDNHDSSQSETAEEPGQDSTVDTKENPEQVVRAEEANEASSEDHFDENDEKYFTEDFSRDCITNATLVLMSQEEHRERTGPMYLTDLPETLSMTHGPFYTRNFVPLTLCGVCGYYSAKAVLSLCRHKFCTGCARLSKSGRTAFCHYCRKQMPAYRLTAASHFVEKLVFQCKCGLEATLLNLQKHLLPKCGSCFEDPVSVNYVPDPAVRNECEHWPNRFEYFDTKDKYSRKEVKAPKDNSNFLRKIERRSNLPHIYMDIEADGLFLGRIFIEVRVDIVPITGKNFLELCTNPNNYSGSFIELVVPHTMLQTGKLSSGRNTTAVRPTFPDENFILKHDKPGTLSMANFGPDTNNTEFCITAAPTPWRDGHNVVFGYVLSGMHIVRRICKNVTEKGYPTRRILIRDCGVINEWELPNVPAD